MPGPDHYHEMTDEALAEWHQLITTNKRLKERVAELETSAAALGAQLNAAKANREEERHQWRTDVDRVCALVERLKQQVRLKEAQNAVVVKALCALLTAFNSPAVLKHQSEWPGEVFRAIREAEELATVLRIPF